MVKKMAWGEVGASALRKENVDAVVKGLAEPKFAMKQIFMLAKSGAWQDSYYRESDLELTAIRGIPRGSTFPHESPLWEKQSAYMKKAGLEVEIFHEDIITDNIDVIARSLQRLSRAVVSVVDTHLWNVLSNNQSGAAPIQTVAVTTGYEWDMKSCLGVLTDQDYVTYLKRVSGQ